SSRASCPRPAPGTATRAESTGGGEGTGKAVVRGGGSAGAISGPPLVKSREELDGCPPSRGRARRGPSRPGPPRRARPRRRACLPGRDPAPLEPSEVRDGERGPRRDQLVVAMGGGDADRAHARGAGGLDADRGVLEDHTAR